MFRKSAATLAVSLLLTGAALASGNVELTDENTAQIRTLLTEQGYEVGKIKIEDGKYEAYAKKDGHRYEVFMNAAFEIVEIEEDD
ncbi:PepSY domain-containing protein [Ovoidimarina sediminis]|uniref:PepSY domain-containing protein n=1 Tax=Ovoidimarina sediminis TaxID=3079856 RepID=UPI002909F30B|nr:PepSY domain-containing protein [Rhodophyticola sp. MJ-SS7]MDU8943374.1 PepSY domain-containing protein [Rhodophyticola sp. MJ-SS7]